MDYPIESYIFYIASKKQVSIIMQDVSYTDPSLNIDGFIHFCSYHQINDVVTSFYSQIKDLKLLIIDINSLQSELRFEAPVGNVSANSSKSELFPHLYGPLNLDAVVDVVDLDQLNRSSVRG